MPENLLTHPADAAWTPARIREKLLQSDVMLERSILKIYDRQTASEQNAGVTVEHNKVGFTAFDAEFMSSLARQIQSPNNHAPEGRRLSVHQRVTGRHKMLKYSKQLARIVDETPMRTYVSIDVTQTRTECPECDGSARITYDDVGEGPVPCRTCEGRGYTL